MKPMDRYRVFSCNKLIDAIEDHFIKIEEKKDLDEAFKDGVFYALKVVKDTITDEKTSTFIYDLDGASPANKRPC